MIIKEDKDMVNRYRVKVTYETGNTEIYYAGSSYKTVFNEYVEACDTIGEPAKIELQKHNKSLGYWDTKEEYSNYEY